MEGSFFSTATALGIKTKGKAQAKGPATAEVGKASLNAYVWLAPNLL